MHPAISAAGRNRAPCRIDYEHSRSNKPIVTTVQRVDSTKILITYHEVPNADQLIELETTVTISKGGVTMQSVGSRLFTTPIQKGGPDIFQ